VDDHTLVRQGIRALLESYPDLSVAGEAGDGEEAMTMVSQLVPNVVLMDINMPGMDGIDATKRIKQEWPEIRVIGLSVNTSSQLIDAMAAAGAAAFVSKDTAADQLYAAITGVMAIEVPADQIRQVRLF
jgi:DNA-binding NarL/FixJ family response regulator